MSCIFCFLKDSHQSELRFLSQMQDERFENILKKYKKIFISGFFQSLNEEVCSSHKVVMEEKIMSFLKQVTSKDLESFFDDLIEKVYINWIEGNAEIAVKELRNLIIQNGLNGDRFLTNVADYLFYRGRKISKTDILNTYDMFHIPFDKRYLIGNQRFSLNGQPLLYLAGSTYNVINELDIEEKNFENVAISSFYIKDETFDVIDLRNPFYIYYDYGSFQHNINILPKITLKNIKSRLFFLILSSMCCFEKRIQHKLKSENINVFFEEYILPQTVTQVYKSMKRKGILFPSTRIREDKENNLSDNLYRTNLVIFTNYNKERHYDRNLYEHLVISNPISIKNIEKFDLEEKHYILIANEITGLLFDSIWTTDSQKDKEYSKRQKTLINLLTLKDKLINSNNNQNNISETLRKMENFLIYNFLIKETFDLKEEAN